MAVMEWMVALLHHQVYGAMASSMIVHAEQVASGFHAM